MRKRLEPVETMGRMALMQELYRWRTIGPALKAVARAVEACRDDPDWNNMVVVDEYAALDRAADRLDRMSGVAAARRRKG